MKEIKGKLVDIVSRETYNALLKIEDGKIIDIIKINEEQSTYILPGFVDSHVHIESSMLPPREFSKLAVKQGTIGTVSDPHEIANVCGIEGVDYMIRNSERTPLKLHFNAPSCVPATCFETSGHVLDSKAVSKLLKKDKIVSLGEMMNFPGVIYDDKEVHAKIKSSLDQGKPVDGHSPSLSGEDAKKYINSGISTDHECSTLDEAIEKINDGMIIQIREGSAAKNFSELHSLLKSHPDKCMLCTDDSHPDDLSRGHINKIVSRAIKLGHDFYDVLRTASYNAIKHYNLNIGLLQKGDPADFIITDNLKEFDINSVYINGDLVYDNDRLFISNESPEIINNFTLNKHFTEEDFIIKSDSDKFKVIKAFDASLFTDSFETILPKIGDIVNTDPLKGINKISVINRYISDPTPSAGFIQGFNISKGAIASTVAHDSHNIVAIGDNDYNISIVVNKLIDSKGGLALYDEEEIYHLPLPIAGLMSDENPKTVSDAYEAISKKARDIGCSLNSPFMTMAFMALLVIPKLKIGDKGLFDVSEFKLTNVES